MDHDLLLGRKRATPQLLFSRVPRFQCAFLDRQKSPSAILRVVIEALTGTISTWKNRVCVNNSNSGHCISLHD
uniref:AlNc14C1G15 protein n=1 Tax=Albugo laibachii Nc14 TaxID=890382 RepID=F0VYK8_9STRA|nr:AlNc14C1G15 [Albugo laibachii Nc14]|eukprot:CCA13872.1 AlNc14C1G15 [Albugo laibachii Nc14]